MHPPSRYPMNRIITSRRSDDFTLDQLPSDLRNGRSLGSGPAGMVPLYAASQDRAGRRDADG